MVVLEGWCKLSALHLNVKKTKEVIFSCNSGKHHVLKVPQNALIQYFKSFSDIYIEGMWLR